MLLKTAVLYLPRREMAALGEISTDVAVASHPMEAALEKEVCLAVQNIV